MAGQFLDDTAITVAGFEIHTCIDPGGVFAQNLFYPAGLLEKFSQSVAASKRKLIKLLETIVQSGSQ